MRAFALSLFILAAVSFARPARAQDPVPRIGPFVIDLHGTFPRFPEDQLVADSRGMNLAELPGTGLGVQVGIHVYPVRWKAITIGLGGEYASGRARQTPPDGATLRSAEERFTSLAPQISLNFGNGHGWSYISGGVGNATWPIVPEGQDGYPPDSEKLKTVNYGFGARWFAKSHLAFSFDVRFYAMNPGAGGQVLQGTPPQATPVPGTPRTTLMIVGAGVSVK